MKIHLDTTALYYPKSFLKLLLLAFGLVALPLVLAFISAAVYVDRIAEQSRTAVSQAAQSARASRELTQEVFGLERTVRQYLILSDPALLKDYDVLRASFKATASELSRLPLDELQVRELNRTIDKERVLNDALRAGTKNRTKRAALIEGYIELSDLSRGVLNISNNLIDREIERLSQTSENARRVLLWQSAAAIPVGVALALFVTFLIARPVRQLDSAIRQLGSGKFDTGVSVSGPADLRYLGERLEWLRSRLVALEQDKIRFLRHVSHELKTPLTALREGSELLADGTMGVLTNPQGEIVAILREKSVQLQRLIESLLQAQRTADELSRLQVAPVYLDEIALRVVADHRLAAAARRINIETRLVPALLEADADKLRVILDNLLSNAIKYSPDGGSVRITLTCAEGATVLDIEDAGPGVPVADRERIFDWFFQGEAGHRGRVTGSGLGLAITRELILAHGGQIEVMSSDAGGALFRVTLPSAPMT